MAAEEYLASLGIDTKDADRALDQIITIVSTASETFTELSARMDKAERALTGVSKGAQSVAKAQAEANREVSEGSDKWKAYAKELANAQSAYREFRKAQVTDESGGKDVSYEDARHLVEIYKAQTASVISEAQKKVATLDAIDQGYTAVAAARSKARAAQEIRQLSQMEAAERQYIATRTALTAAQNNVTAATKGDDKEALAASLAAQVQAINNNAVAYKNLADVRDRDAKLAEEAARRSIAAIQQESAARTAAYTKALAEAARLDAQQKAASDAARYAGGFNIGQGTANASNTASQNGNATYLQKQGQLTERLNGELSDMNRYYADLERSTASAAAAQSKENLALSAGSRSAAELTGNLPRLRYALYDVSNALTIGSAVMLAGVGAASAISIAWQRDFSQVQRTSGATGDSLTSLRSDFTELAQTIPETYDSLTQIGTLGGQLDVPTDKLANFTGVVAKFSSTTDVSVDAAATAFGRLDALLPGVNGNYEGLGSAILKVGTNSVATESDIISVTSQIAASGSQAGLSADEVIGLAGAFGSLGIPAESARGTTLRFFSTLNGALSGTNPFLQDFAALSGKTADTFRTDWANDRGAALTDLLKGIGEQGPGAEAALAALGITASRDINNLLKLAQNTDILTESLSNSETGMADANELTNQYGITSATVASKIQLLQNNAAALISTLSGATTGPLAGVIDLLNLMLKVATDLAANPVYQWVAFFGATIVTLAAILGLGVAGVLRFQASILAMRVAFVEASAQGLVQEGVLTRLAAKLNILNVATLEAAASERALAASTGQANAQMGAASVGGAKLSSVLGKVGLIGTILALIPLVAEFTSTMTSDAAMAAAGVDDLDAAVRRLTGNKADLQAMINSLGQAQDAGLGSVNGQAINFANADSGLNDAQQYRDRNGLADAGFGWIDGASTSVDLFDQKLKVLQATMIATFNAGNTAQAQSDFKALTDQLILMGFNQDEVNAFTSDYRAIVSDAGGAAGIAADQQADLNSMMRESFDLLQSNVNANVSVGNSLYSLGQALYENGDAFGYYSAEGRNNTAALQSTISSYVSAFGDDAQALANNLQALYQYILQNTNAPAAAVAMLQNAISATGMKPNGMGSTFAVTPLMDGYTDSANKAAAAAEKASDAIQEQVVSLEDYANDLKGVFSRAFDLRFGNDQAFDDINSGWNSISAAIADVNQQIREYQADMGLLTADRATKEYWLSVAENYGDALRAGELRAELADIDNQLAEKADDLTAAQAKNSKTIDGNSQAAIDNRAELLGLVSTYEDYVTQLASSGLSQAELQVRVAQLKQEFIAQATQMGYSQTAVLKYSAAFDDLAVSINGVPRNITIGIDGLGPAEAALREFVAKARDIASNSGVTIPISTAADTSGLEKAARGTKIAQQMAAYERAAALSERNDPARADYLRSLASQLADVLNSGSYMSGGPTGNGPRNKVAGVVHGQEYVLNARGAQMIPRNVLDAANQGRAVYQAPMRAPKASAGVGGPDYSRRMVGLLETIAKNAGVFLPGDALAGAVGGSQVNGANRRRY